MKLSNGNHVEMDDNLEVDPAEEPIERKTCAYKNRSERFLKCSKDFGKQYAHIYAARLSSMRKVLLNKIKLKWDDKYPIRKLHELREEKVETCVIIGTLFKHQDLKPSILKEISDELETIPQPQRTNYVEDNDYLILEDELQRIRLKESVIDVTKVVTGIVCAILGYENSDGSLKALECCWVGCSPEKPLVKFDDDRYIVIASGLNFSSIKDNNFAIELFNDWLRGLVGDRTQREDVAKTVRLIIAGNSVSGLKSDSVECRPLINISTNYSAPGFDSLDALKKLDDFLYDVCQSISVDIMPGEFDPSNIMLPQQPMHYCMFPKSIQMTSFNGVSNPYECDIGGRNICGTSGQPVGDILKYGLFSSQLEVLRNTLLWGHIAPTAPDTLPCTPSEGVDPFILENCPDVYFSGNADKYDTELYTGEDGKTVRLICVPSFAATRTVVIVNLRNLECHPMSFMVENGEQMDVS